MQTVAVRRIACFALAVALLLPVTELVTPASVGAATVYQAPASIDATGVADVSADLAAFVQQVPDGSTITFPPNAHYRIESGFVISGRNDLVIDGNGAEFFATTDGSGATPMGPTGVTWLWPRHRDQILVYKSTNVTLRNLAVRGANPNAGLSDSAYVEQFEAQAGVEFFGTVNSRLESCRISDTYGDFVYIGQGSQNTSVSNCTMTRSGRQGISVVDAQGVFVHHNDLSLVRRSMFTLEPYVRDWSVGNVWIVYNTIGDTRLSIVGAKGEGDVSGVVYAYNRHIGVPMRIKNTPLYGRRHDWYVIGNTSDRTYGSPHGSVWMFRTDRVLVVGNYQPLQSGRNPAQIATEFNECSSVGVIYNQFPYL